MAEDKFTQKATVQERYNTLVQEHSEAIAAAIRNERITRARFEEFVSRGTLGRLKWLLLGL